MWNPIALALVVTTAVLVVPAILSVPLRFLARRKQDVRTGLDDWYAVVALLATVVLSASNIASVPISSQVYPGQPADEMERILETSAILQYVQIYTALSAVAFAKLSLLHLFKRVFTGHRTPFIITATIAIVWLWFLALLAVVIYLNFSAEYNQSSESVYLFTVISSATDLALDLFLGFLPFLWISKLQLSQQKRYAIAGIFGLGLICAISSGVRLAFSIEFIIQFSKIGSSVSLTDYSRTYVLLPGIEASISTIVINLPCYSPFLMKSNSRNRNKAPPRSARFGSRSEEPLAPYLRDMEQKAGVDEEGRPRGLGSHARAWSPNGHSRKPSYGSLRQGGILAETTFQTV